MAFFVQGWGSSCCFLCTLDVFTTRNYLPNLLKCALCIAVFFAEDPTGGLRSFPYNVFFPHPIFSDQPALVLSNLVYVAPPSPFSHVLCHKGPVDLSRRQAIPLCVSALALPLLCPTMVKWNCLVCLYNWACIHVYFITLGIQQVPFLPGTLHTLIIRASYFWKLAAIFTWKLCSV